MHLSLDNAACLSRSFFRRINRFTVLFRRALGEVPMMVLERSRPHRLAAVVCLILLSAAPCRASHSSTSATIRGIVQDDTGGLPGATITAKEVTAGFTLQRHLRQRTASSCSPACGPAPTTSRWRCRSTSRPPAGSTGPRRPEHRPRLPAHRGPRLRGERHGRRRRRRSTSRRRPGRDERHRGADREPAAERPQLPQLRRPRPRRARQRREPRKEVTAGALAGLNTNVFIDGVSYKNDILEGGVVGQDS